MPDEISYTEHAQDVLAKACELIARKERFALVVSLDIKGGTARELGSLAIVTPAGLMFGYLSNGCIDQDIRLNAMQCLESGDRKVLHYGDGSPFPDLTLPCGGMLKVLLDPDPDLDRLTSAFEDLTARRPAHLSFDAIGNLGPLAVEYSPKPRVTLAGRGAVFRATAKLADASGFEVSCLTPDEVDAVAVAQYCVDTVATLVSPNAAQDLSLDAWSAFLTLFHDHSWEPYLLKAALQTPCRFVGALGSQRTHDARQAVLLAMGCAPGDVERIRGPVGLVPSLRSADLIAVAVLAELADHFSRSQRCLSMQLRTRCEEPADEQGRHDAPASDVIRQT